MTKPTTKPVKRLLATTGLWIGVTLLMMVGLSVDPISASAGGTVLPGTRCPAFPSDDGWNTPITDLPVNASSATWLTTMAATQALIEIIASERGVPMGREHLKNPVMKL